MFSVGHASSKVQLRWRRRGEEQQASSLVAKRAVEFPQVLAIVTFHNPFYIEGVICFFGGNKSAFVMYQQEGH